MVGPMRNAPGAALGLDDPAQLLGVDPGMNTLVPANR